MMMPISCLVVGLARGDELALVVEKVVEHRPGSLGSDVHALDGEVKGFHVGRVFLGVLDLPVVCPEQPAAHAGDDVARRILGEGGLGQADDGLDRFQIQAVLSCVGGHPAVKEGGDLGRAQEAVVGQVLDRPAPVVGTEAEVEATQWRDDLHRRLHRAQAGDAGLALAAAQGDVRGQFDATPTAVHLERARAKVDAGDFVFQGDLCCFGHCVHPFIGLTVRSPATLACRRPRVSAAT